MNSEFAWFYDALVVIIIVICVYICGKRGFLRSAVMFVGYIAVFIASVLVSNSAAPSLYSSYVQDSVITSIEEQLGEVDIIGELRTTLNNKYGKYGINFSKKQINEFLDEDKEKTASNIIDFVYEKAGFTITAEDTDGIIGSAFNDKINDKAREYIPSNIFGGGIDLTESDTWRDAVTAVKGDSRDIAVFIEKYFVRESVVSIIRLIVMILTFVILTAIINVVVHALKVVDKIPVISEINTFFGGVLGIFQGVIWVYLISLMVRLLIAVGGNDMLVFNAETIDITYIFRYFYYFNI